MRRIFSSAAVLLLSAWPAAAQIKSEPVAPLSGASAAPSPLPTLAVPLAPVLTSPAGLTAAPALSAAPAAAAPVAVLPPAPAVLAAPALAPAAQLPAALLPPAAGGPAPTEKSADSPAGADASGGHDAKLDATFDGSAAADGLTRLAFDVTPKTFPGGSGAAETLGRNMRAIVTKKIAAADLPYETTLRPAGPVSLPATLETAPRAAVRKVTDIAFASEEHSGSAGLVRLGYLEDGRPVALKAYHLRGRHEELNDFMLEETRSAKMLSDLGVGPRFHGVWRDHDGSWNVVFDIARGDFSGTPVTRRTFSDLETILTRLKNAGVRSFGDLQLYRDENGRLSVIDPGSAAKGGAPHAEPDQPGGYATQVRMEQLFAAAEPEGRYYLEWLSAHRPEAFASLREVLRRRPDPFAGKVKRLYPDYFPSR
jgi:hypothetical protein